MIHSDILKNLTEQERDMLLTIVNVYNPPLKGLEADLNIIKTYRHSALSEIIKKVKNEVKEESVPIYDNLCKKLNIQT